MYVRFGNDFNAAVIAFDSFVIDMGDLKRVPDDLRDILERCVAEDASPENLNLYLPSVHRMMRSEILWPRLFILGWSVPGSRCFAGEHRFQKHIKNI